MSLRVAGSRVVTGDGIIRDGVISIDDRRITTVAADLSPGRDPDLHGAWVLPGAVDLHCHGGGGADLASPDLDEVLAALTAHRRHGTTTSLISLVSAPLDVLCAQLARIAGWMEDPATGLAEFVAGIHLEGPFLSTVRCGAIDPTTMLDATPEATDALFDAARGHLRVVTIAPERPGALDAIATLTDAGVVVAVGHTDASAEAVHAAIAAGARLATHLGNAMGPFHHRAPGAFGACLADGAVTAELIVDGRHLHPDTVSTAVAAKGADSVTFCTDAVLAAAAPPGRYELGGQSLTVTDGTARLDRTGALAGSLLMMDRAVANTVGWGIDVRTVARAVAANPARLVGLDDRGVITAGRRADLMVFDDDWSLVGVVAAGVLVDGVPVGDVGPEGP